MCENDVRPSASRGTVVRGCARDVECRRRRAHDARFRRRPGGADTTATRPRAILGLARVRASDRSHMAVFRSVYVRHSSRPRAIRRASIATSPSRVAIARIARDDREKPDVGVERRGRVTRACSRRSAIYDPFLNSAV